MSQVASPPSATSIADRSRSVALAQGALGMSPASYSPDGHLVLCAASCIAFAALSVREGRSAAEAFRAALTTRERDFSLEQVFAEVGLSAEACRAIRERNDSLAPSERLSWFLEQEFVELECAAA